MLDTVKLKRPLADEREASLIEAKVQTMTKTDNASGDELFRFVGGNLEGSFSNNIAVNVKREVYRRIPAAPGQKAQSISVPCGWEPGQPRPFLTIEGSVHKAMCGHNVYGGPLDPEAASFWFAVHVCDRLGVNFGSLADWFCLRVDWAECYNFGSFEAVEEFIRAMKLASYPRRVPLTYPGEVMFPSSNITTKFYHKGLEFQKNGIKAVLSGGQHAQDARKAFCAPDRALPEEEDARILEILRLQGEEVFYRDEEFKVRRKQADALLNLANGILRTEITVKSKRLKLEAVMPGHAEMPVVDLKREWLEALHDTEVLRVFREGKADMKSVRTHEDVNARLREMYNPRLAETLFGVWMQCAALGRDEYKKKVPKSTFHHQMGQLAKAGVSDVGCDIGIVRSNVIPLDFSFRRDSSFRMSQELPEVVELLLPFRRAA